jgi:hypothetical protein
MIYKSVTEFEAVLAVLEDSVDRLEEAVYEDCPDDNDLESNWEESDSSWYDELADIAKELPDGKFKIEIIVTQLSDND